MIDGKIYSFSGRTGSKGSCWHIKAFERVPEELFFTVSNFTLYCFPHVLNARHFGDGNRTRACGPLKIDFPCGVC
jgi:hypothetical protein